MIYVVYLLSGLFAGLLSGLFGIGGGIILVPLLTLLLEAQQLPSESVVHYAVGTALATMVFSTMAATAFQYWQRAIHWKWYRLMMPGTVIGAAVGNMVGDHLPRYYLHTTFSVVCLLVAWQFLFKLPQISKPTQTDGLVPLDHPPKIRPPKAPPHMALLAFLVGIMAGLVGIGGGVIWIPVLMLYGISMRHAGALAVSCSLPTALAGAMTAVMMGWDQPPIHLSSWGYVIWPVALIQGLCSIPAAKVGILLANYLPRIWLRRIFGILLVLIAGIMLPIN